MSEDDPGPEEQRLIDRLFNDPNRRTLNFHVDWGPEAHRYTREHLCAELNRAFDQIENGTATPLDFEDSQRDKVDVRDFVAGLDAKP